MHISVYFLLSIKIFAFTNKSVLRLLGTSTFIALFYNLMIKYNHIMIVSFQSHVERATGVTFHRINNNNNNSNKNKLIKCRYLIFFFFSLARGDRVNLHNTMYKIIILCKSSEHLLLLHNTRYGIMSLGNKRPRSYSICAILSV